MAASKDYTNHIVGGAILIIVILVGIYFATQNRPAPSTDTETGTATGTTNTNTSGIALAAADQAAGESVMVSGISVTSVSWIAVRDADGLRVLGAARVSPGTTSVEVPLMRATVAGNSYQVVAYTDDGDRAFDMKSDTLVANVADTFSAQ